MKIGYINIRGLTNEKWNALLSSLETPMHSGVPSFDILFISETWFVDHRNHACHPLFLASSPNSRHREGGRQHGGLLALVTPSLRQSISSLCVNVHSISVSLSSNAGQLTVSAVYLPPSLSPSNVSSILASLPSPDIIIGDVNARYGRSFGDSASGPPQRKAVLDAHMARKHFIHLRPSVGFAHVDHAYISSSLASSSTTVLSFADSTLSTDHPMVTLSMAASSSDAMHAQVDEPARRYNLKYLSNAVTARYFGNAYDSLYGQHMTHLFSHIEETPPDVDGDDCQVIIDTMDSLLLDAVHCVSEHVLGSYKVNAMKKTDDLMTEALSDPSLQISPSTAARLFKRSQRSQCAQSKIISRNNSTTAVDDAVAFYEEAFASPAGTTQMPRSRSYAFQADPLLSNLYTEHSVKQAISSYPNSKSPGGDGVDALLLKTLTSTSTFFLKHATSLFRCCTKFGLTPRRWNEAIIYPIPKSSPPPPTNTIDTLRPISLTVLFRRIFERILLQAVTFAPEWASLRSFNPGQAGFRRGFSTLTQALLSHEGSVFNNAQIKVFIDLKQAYDRVPTSILLEKLSLRSPSNALLCLIDSLFSNCSSRLVINGILSRSFDRGRGLLQGSILSPWLFNIFIDDLADTLNPPNFLDTRVPVKALLFADDIQIQAKSADEAQQLLDRTSSWILQNHMEANLNKCGVITNFELLHPLTLTGSPLSVVQSYKYLGFPHEADGINWTLHLQRGMSRTNGTLNYLKSSGHVAGWPEWARLAVYKSIIRSLLEYGAPLVFQALLTPRSRPRKRRRSSNLSVSALLTELEACQKGALGWIFQCRPAPPIVLQSLTALSTLQSHFDDLAFRFTLHIRSIHIDHPLHFYLTKFADSLSARCTRHPLRAAFEQLPASPAGLKSKIRAFLLSRRLDVLSSSKSKLSSYILRSARIPSNGLAKLLFLKDSKIRSLAIKWHRNTLAIYTKCCQCDLPFRRSHIDTCFAEFIPPLAYEREYSPECALPGYTRLDYLLNRGDYEGFYSLWTSIAGHLVPL